MTDSTTLKTYFDALLKNKQHDSGHPLGEDAKRFLFFGDIRRDFGRIGKNLDGMVRDVNELYPEYTSVTQRLSENFYDMSRINDEEFDYYLRTLAVEQLIFTKAGAGNLTPEMMKYLIDALMVLFFEEGETIAKQSKQTLVDLKQKKPKLFSVFWKKDKTEERLRDDIEETLTIYEQVEGDLKEAKLGVMARDKKMLEVLQTLRADLRESLIEAALDTSQIAKAEPKKRAGSFRQALKEESDIRKVTKKIKQEQETVANQQALRQAIDQQDKDKGGRGKG